MSNTKTTVKSVSQYPFLKNFPFGEFIIDIEQNIPEVNESGDGLPSVIKFIYERDKSVMTILIFEQDLLFIHKVAESITELDIAVKIINNALASPDLLLKRNATIFAEKWCSQLQDNQSRLSYSATFEILLNLVDSQSALVSIINKIGKLQLVKGVVGLTQKEYAIVLTYYQFQLIYAKLLLGLVIASKISL